MPPVEVPLGVTPPAVPGIAAVLHGCAVDGLPAIQLLLVPQPLEPTAEAKPEKLPSFCRLLLIADANGSFSLAIVPAIPCVIEVNA
jgi:hypothetical protein